MNDWQTPVAMLVVLGAAAYLARCWWRGRKAPGSGCGKGCGCPSDKSRLTRGKR